MSKIKLFKFVEGELVKEVTVKSKAKLSEAKSKLLKGEGFNCVIKMVEVKEEE